ncbi:class I SAM-dependent methyltransferase [endosymbiont of Ridgeia piscesae]|jgi:cyclopropane-fatty-acyl-phospholipid synthase|uniref:Cyclopropane fatty-acyl-phospholipid synthase or methyltransferase-like protein n=1 Tax=endosymbiont of Ridgeia piscesae TaxID=54398 RepID=A0A0T5YWN0_9GAMM|nr:class I SAM-dependent methyltransferase [endosymbiont of Ridgeia piscesae]KRT54927.1 Cyclopropane fatty-acyl-phospholipid synthase or methyltransferase-like protein [endosymbiont of Ridgeia piscesae]KRT59654.1 cyclopropane-fatty-acyl-phospholipid synthase [endosymbiont of Ridgeia piscesae]
MEQHYNESETLFSNFLDQKYLAYSMAYFDETGDAAQASQLSLEEAQTQKFKRICERCNIQGDERVLNIGCGFGSFEHYLLERFPKLNITSVTASRTQADYIRRQAGDPDHPLAAAGLRLINAELDQLSDEELGIAEYDLVTSIGVLEHAKNLQQLFARITRLLKPGGASFHHLIVSKQPITRFLSSSNTLIDKYFPGGRIWPYQVLAQQTEHLNLENHWFINGMNYWHTLDEWHRRFWEHIDVLQQEGFDTEAIRYWNDYFSLSKACFAPMNGEIFGNGQFLYRKPDAPD